VNLAVYRFEERQSETNGRARRAFFVISRTNEISKAVEVSHILVEYDV
jgi:hypothetical protein